MPPLRISRVASLFESSSRPRRSAASTQAPPVGRVRRPSTTARCGNTCSSSRPTSSTTSPAKSFSAAALGLAHRRVAVHQPRHLARQRALRMPLLGLARARRLELRRSRARVEEREELQVPHRVAIVGVQPELIELVRRRQRRIEPDRARFGLAELRSRRRRDERQHQAVRLRRRARAESDPCRP